MVLQQNLVLTVDNMKFNYGSVVQILRLMSHVVIVMNNLHTVV